ncbi:hypothetical protein FUAX_10110 [Fulvitalea axinellae]|uniref:6-bladed beta-propeller n=1 Tax=Fulvitalea axinellae TaxID=1182444 RepID=A0AAU9C986_9BACT|nr:hypothetical protein FUAX_10110 [Fulvitalea axinellae]
MILRIFTLLAFVSFFCSCTSNKKKSPDDNSLKVITLDPSAPQKNCKLSGITDSVKVIKLENKEEALLGRYPQLRHIDNQFAVFSEGEQDVVLVFDLEGKHLFTIADKGEGPKEYRSIEKVSVQNQKIYIVSSEKVLVYDFKGKQVAVRYHGRRGGDWQILSENSWAFFPYQNYYSSNRKGVLFFDSAFNLLKTEASKSSEVLDKSYNISMHTSVQPKRFGDEWIYQGLFTDTLYHLTSQGSKPFALIKSTVPQRGLLASVDLGERKKATARGEMTRPFWSFGDRYCAVNYVVKNERIYSLIDFQTGEVLFHTNWKSSLDKFGLINDALKGAFFWPDYLEKDRMACLYSLEKLSDKQCEELGVELEDNSVLVVAYLKK